MSVTFHPGYIPFLGDYIDNMSPILRCLYTWMLSLVFFYWACVLALLEELNDYKVYSRVPKQGHDGSGMAGRMACGWWCRWVYIRALGAYLLASRLGAHTWGHFDHCYQSLPISVVVI
jgi:hypothetical protein